MIDNPQIFTIENITSTAKQLISLNKKIILFNAPMGAGKTTLIKEICKQLGSYDSFSSPTYQIVNEYNYPNGKIYHFDLYRIKTLNELLDIGFEEYTQPHNYCFIEWPDLAKDFLKTNFIDFTIIVEENIRYFCFKEF